MFGAGQLEKEHGLTTRATLTEYLNLTAGPASIPPEKRGSWSVPKIANEGFPQVPFFWLNVTGNPTTSLRFNQIDTGNNSFGFVTDTYQILKDKELEPMLLRAAHVHNEKYPDLDTLKLTGTDGVFQHSITVYLANSMAIQMVENGNSLRMVDVHVPSHPNWTEAIGFETRLLIRTPTERKFLESQQRAKIMLGEEGEAPEFETHGIVYTANGKSAELEIHHGKVGVSVEGLDKSTLRKTLRGRVITNEGLNKLVASSGSSKMSLTLQLRDGLVTGVAISGDGEFVEKGRGKVLPEDVYAFIEELTRKKIDERNVDENVGDFQRESTIWQPSSLEEYQRGVGSYQVSDSVLERIEQSRGGRRKVVGPKRKGGRNRTKYSS